MQNCETKIGNGYSAPPPPPPLPPAVLPNKQLNKQNCNCLFSDIKSEEKSSQHDIVSALRHITHNFYIENPGTLVSIYNHVYPVMQNGRCCGIVALSMASQLICGTSVDDILNTAKSMNFTKEGEMFSAYNMASLAETLLKCDAVVLHDLTKHKIDVLNHICDGNPVLVPYDADKNHFPCINHGLSAHWAVITGLCFNVSNKTHLSLLSGSETVKEYPELDVYIVKDSLLAKNLLHNSERIFLYAHQGKSRHLSAWDLNDVIESNSSMYEVTTKYSSQDLVLPKEDYLSELRNKIVLLKQKSKIL